MVEANYDPGETLNKKIRNAQLAQFNFILGKWGIILNLEQYVVACWCPVATFHGT